MDYRIIARDGERRVGLERVPRVDRTDTDPYRQRRGRPWTDRVKSRHEFSLLPDFGVSLWLAGIALCSPGVCRLDCLARLVRFVGVIFGSRTSQNVKKFLVSHVRGRRQASWEVAPKRSHAPRQQKPTPSHELLRPASSEKQDYLDLFERAY